MSRKPLLILGTRTLAVEVADIAGDTGEWEVAGFVENMNRDRCGAPLEGLPVHWIDELASFARTHWAICGLGTTARSAFTAQAEAHGIPFATIVHPSARVSRNSRVGDGSLVSAGAMIATHTSIGRHVIINRGVLIGHHTTIGDHVSVMPGANIAGECTIGAGCYIGMGAIVIDHLSVGDGCFIGAGSVVTKSIPSGVQVVGAPARIVKDGISGR